MRAGKLQVFKSFARETCLEWLRELPTLSADWERELFVNSDSVRRAVRHSRDRFDWLDRDEYIGDRMSARGVKTLLLELVSGVPTTINGVPVTRIPCAGRWFDVGVHWEPHDVTKQRLRLADAISRVKSGYYPRLANPPGMRAYYERLRDEQRIHLNEGHTRS